MKRGRVLFIFHRNILRDLDSGPGELLASFTIIIVSHTHISPPSAANVNASQVLAVKAGGIGDMAIPMPDLGQQSINTAFIVSLVMGKDEESG